MDIFSVLTMVGGLALFLYGMNAMGDGLSKLSGGKMEQILEKMTSTRISAVLLGALVTAVIQSSSATTVMVVGFVNSGIMHLSQAVGIIMGANVGTTITSWLLSLTGIEGSNLFIKLLKPSSFSPVLAAVGMIMMMTGKKDTKKADVGNILLGFAILMFGMETMSDAVAPLSSNAKFTGILTAFSNPVLGMLAGALLTAVIQSSSASVGILQALCVTGAVGYGTAIPIIMGQNIGTCVTAILSSIGANKNARRASMLHLYFNLIGTVVFMVVFYGLNSFIHFPFLQTSANAAGIAVIHSVFNVGCAILLFPFANGLVKLATLSIPGEAIDQEDDYHDIRIDERFLEQPGFAMELCKNKVREMADAAKESLLLSLQIVLQYDETKAMQVEKLERRVDAYEDIVGSYLVRLSAKNLSKKDSQSMSVLLHTISDFERISDHALNIAESAKELETGELSFSDKAMKDLMVLSDAVSDIIEKTVAIFQKEDISEAVHIEPLEEVIDTLTKEIKKRHIKRLQKGKCSVETGIILEDLLINLERVADHCSNVAVCLIEIADNGFDTHSYVDQVTSEDNEEFRMEYEHLKKQYQIKKKKRKE